MDTDERGFLFYFERGNHFLRQNEFKKAVEEYSKSIKINPQDSLAYNNRGLAYGHLKEYEKAVEDYSKSIKINPQDSEAYNNR